MAKRKPAEPRLSHIDKQGRITMVDVGAKATTQREAIARGSITMSKAALALPYEQSIKDRARWTVDEIRRSRADGVVFLYKWGCNTQSGIARALVTEPHVLLMDEAFSALDVLTGETLRDDMLELWQERRISTKGILVVSHNIEEAVMMADRIILLSSDPGRVRCEIPVNLPRPRDPDSAEVRALIDEVSKTMIAGGRWSDALLVIVCSEQFRCIRPAAGTLKSADNHTK